MAASCGPRPSIVFVLLLLTLQPYPAMAIPSKRAPEQVKTGPECEPYLGLISDFMKDVKSIGKAGAQAIEDWDRNYFFPRNVDLDERRRIQMPLDALFGNMAVPLWEHVSGDHLGRVEQAEG